MISMGGNTSSLEWNLQSKKTKTQEKLVVNIWKMAHKGETIGRYRRAFMMAVRRVWGSKRDRYYIVQKNGEIIYLNWIEYFKVMSTFTEVNLHNMADSKALEPDRKKKNKRDGTDIHPI